MSAPVFVAAAKNSTSFSATSTPLALDVGSASGRCVLVLASNTSSNSTTPSSATYGGVAMTAGTLSTATGNNQFRLFWLYNVAATGSNNIVVTYNDGNGKPTVVAASYSNVDTTAGVSGETVGHGQSTTPSWTVTSATGDLAAVLSFMDVGTSGAQAATSPAVADFTDHSGTEIYDSFVWSKAGASSVTVAGTTGTPNPNWFGTVVSLKSGTVVVVDNPVNPGVGTLAITGPVPTVTRTGGSTALVPGVGSLAITGPAPTVARTVGVPTFSTPVLKNNTGTVLANETGVVVNVYNATTGALVVRKTGLTSSSLGVVVVTDAAMTAATTYSYEVVLSTLGRRLPTAVAA